MESSRSDPQAMATTGLPWSPLAWSLGLHGLMLAALAPVWLAGESGVPPSRVLQTRLQPVAPIVPVAPLMVPAPPVLPSPPPQPASRLSATPASAAVPPAPTFSPGPVRVADPPAAGGEVVATAEQAVPSVALAPQAPEAGLPDAAGLREYRLALAGEARRYRRYPEQAQRLGWSGTVEVRIAVSPLQRQAELARSSGHPSLDAAALAMLQQALVQTPLPSSLRQQHFSVLLPVVFEVAE